MKQIKSILVLFSFIGCSVMVSARNMTKIGNTNINKSSDAQALFQFDAEFGPKNWLNSVDVFRYSNKNNLLFIYTERKGKRHCIFVNTGIVYELHDPIRIAGKPILELNGEHFNLYSKEEWGKKSR